MTETATKDKAGTPGKITRYFKVVCAICEESTTLPANGIDDFTTLIDKEWRLSRDRGWTHKKCCKLMPVKIKF